MGCRCEHLPRSTRHAAHIVHTRLEESLRHVRQLSQRYIPFLRPHVPDPTIVRMVSDDRQELRALQHAIRNALPEPDHTRVLRSYPEAIQEYVTRERRNHTDGTKHERA